MSLETIFTVRNPHLDNDIQDIRINNAVLKEKLRGIKARNLEMVNEGREAHNKSQKSITFSLIFITCCAVIIAIRLIALYFFVF